MTQQPGSLLRPPQFHTVNDPMSNPLSHAVFAIHSTTLMHLLAMTEAGDAPRLKDVLSKRADTLRQMLWQQADSAVMQMTDEDPSLTNDTFTGAADNTAVSPAPASATATSSEHPLGAAATLQSGPGTASVPLPTVGSGSRAARTPSGTGMADVISALRSMHVRLPSDPFCLRAAGMAISASPSPSMGSSPPYSPSMLSKFVPLGGAIGETGWLDSVPCLTGFSIGSSTATALSPFACIQDTHAQAPQCVQACGVCHPPKPFSIVQSAVKRAMLGGGGCRVSSAVAEELSIVGAALAGLAQVLGPLRDKHAAFLGDVEVLQGQLQVLRGLAAQ